MPHLPTLHQLQWDDFVLPLLIRPIRTARRMTLRYQPLTRQAVLTIPRRVRIAEALTFAQTHRDWLHRQMSRAPAPQPFADGAQIPVFGRMHRIAHLPAQRLNIRAEEDRLLVGGGAEFLSRRVGDWLKKAARAELSRLAQEKAAHLDVKITAVSVRDTGSRWGSCNSAGRLSFSWRLIFAPEGVLDYLVCHEVAHLLEMNHSDAFWRIVASLCPEWQKHKRWLSAHGHELYRYG